MGRALARVMVLAAAAGGLGGCSDRTVQEERPSHRHLAAEYCERWCGGEPPGPLGTSGGASDGGVDSSGGDGSSGGAMSSLEGLYEQVRCERTTCTIGPELVDAVLSSPEVLLAEGTSVAFVASEGRVVGLEVRGVAAGTLAGALGLRERDVIMSVGGRPVTSEAEVMAAVTWVVEAKAVELVVLRQGRPIAWMLVRG